MKVLLLMLLWVLVLSVLVVWRVHYLKKHSLTVMAKTPKRKRVEEMFPTARRSHITTPDGKHLPVVDEDTLFARAPLMSDDGEFLMPVTNAYDGIDAIEDDDMMFAYLTEMMGNGDVPLAVLTDEQLFDDGIIRSFGKPGGYPEHRWQTLLKNLEDMSASYSPGSQLIDAAPSFEVKKKALYLEVLKQRTKQAIETEGVLLDIDARKRQAREIVAQHQDKTADIVEDYHHALEDIEATYREERLERDLMFREEIKEMERYQQALAQEIPDELKPLLTEALTVANVANMLNAWLDTYGDGTATTALEWYFTRPVLRYFCTLNELYPANATAKRLVSNWVQTYHPDGLRSYPTNLMGLPIAYHLGSDLLVGDSGSIAVILAERYPTRNANGLQLRALALQPDGTIRPIDISVGTKNATSGDVTE